MSWLVKVRMRMGVNTGACVYASAKLRPTLQSHQGVDAEANQHERHTEFKQTGNSIADANVKQDYGQSGDQERDSMAYAPKASDNRRTKKRFALTYNG